MSVLGKIWEVKNTDSALSLSEKLLANRGLKDAAEIQSFLYPELARDFHDPFLMRDMARGVERIGKAIEGSERVMIFGDYDVDGITGTAILMRALRKLGANVSCRLPHRIEDGYGLRPKFIDIFAELGVKVLITVDNGISCLKEVERANERGIDVIITDHHTVPAQIPPAFAILHPKLPGDTYPFSELTGAGVALKLAQALLQTRLSKVNGEVADLMDLAAMGTIADLGLLRGENRYIVKEGLKVLENTRWPGLSRLKESAGIKGKIDTHDIGFLLCPRINAAGRISHPTHALKLLLHETDDAHVLAANLEQLNRRRQRLMEELMTTAEELASAQADNPAIIIAHRTFHGGVIGLIAAKLSEKYCRPAIIMEEREEFFVGSCRSVPGVNVVEALTSVKDLLTAFGGHSAAAGFELPRENFERFAARMNEAILFSTPTLSPKPTFYIDCELRPDEISTKTLEIINNFQPFGIGNEVPRFLLKNAGIHSAATVGKDKNHLKMALEIGDSTIDCIGFKLGEYLNGIARDATINLVCELEENVWNERARLQLKILDFAVALG